MLFVGPAVKDTLTRGQRRKTAGEMRTTLHRWGERGKFGDGRGEVVRGALLLMTMVV